MDEITSSHLERYRGVVDDSLLTEIYALARALRGIRVAHYNTSKQGGGIVTILQAMLPVMEELGLPHEWQVVTLNDDACIFMAKLSDMIQGGVEAEITASDHEAFLSAIIAGSESTIRSNAAVHFIHDLQLTPMADLFPALRPAVWFCHVDAACPNPDAMAYLLQFFGSYQHCAFNTPASVFKCLPPNRTSVVTLGIDAFHPRNVALAPSIIEDVLRKLNIDGERPLIAQVARFGRWKNPWQVIEIYRQVKAHIPATQVALMGAMEAPDDIMAQEIYVDVARLADSDPDIHLLADPDLVGNLQVNALQRHANVICQRSLHEGFGLTVTEALWKSQPVVGTSATGIKYQIEHGRNGFIADATEASANYAIDLIEHPELAKKLGISAHETVQERFLVPMMIRSYLQLLSAVT